ncbi:MAG: hypothetical protein RMJ14_01790 [Nitrososphaerota archaeon]|nr:hypothetical protein [Aigarchaeota archaeon]MDW8076355.1 hypothetical protein [Nitrososphaerota archaeon]
MNIRIAYVLGLLTIGLILLIYAILYELFVVGTIGFVFIFSAILIWSLTKGHHTIRR